MGTCEEVVLASDIALPPVLESDGGAKGEGRPTPDPTFWTEGVLSAGACVIGSVSVQWHRISAQLFSATQFISCDCNSGNREDRLLCIGGACSTVSTQSMAASGRAFVLDLSFPSANDCQIRDLL